MGTIKKKKKWMKFRHRVIRNVAYAVLYPYTRWKYGVQIEKFKEQGDRQYLIIMNHQTAFDQFFVGMAFKGPIYYIATEDLFSMGFLSKLLTYAVAPIPIKKQATDVQAVFNCVRVVKEGGTIALAPEGNRTYSGRTVYIKPSIVKLIRAIKLPIAVFRIEGGYGVQPRWSDVVRKGDMRAYVSRVVEPEEYKALSDEELYALIVEALAVNEDASGGLYYHKKSAEYLDRVTYVCPECGLSVFHSQNDIIECTKCKRQIRYLPDKQLEGVGFEFPFRYVADWYDYQNRFVNALDTTAYLEKPMYQDGVSLSEVILYQRKHLLQKDVEMLLYSDRIVIKDVQGADISFAFDTIEVVAVLGKNKLNIYHGGKVYQIKGDKHFNALKYVNMYYHYRNTREGNGDGEFLGL